MHTSLDLGERLELFFGEVHTPDAESARRAELSMFDTDKYDLKELLKHVDQGRLQLPDFQRDYVWGDNDVQSLIASVAKGFPIGALLTLESGGAVQFKPRLLVGVPERDVKPRELLLDGQQRITSLYQAMFSSAPIRTRTPKGTEIERYYYLNIEKAAMDGADLEDAIVGVPADRIVRTNFGRDVVLDLSAPSSEYEHDLFPLNRVFDPTDWQFGWREYWRDRKRDCFDMEKRFFKGVIERIQHYKVPIIRLDKENSREAICLVFEKVNVGGKKLDAFELVTAIYAAEAFDLRADWLGSPGGRRGGRKARMMGTDHPRDVLRETASTDFLQACTLLHTREVRLARAQQGQKGKELPQVSCKREALLSLPLAAYRKYADAVEKGFVEAAAFLNELKIIWHKDVPYPPQIVALAATFAILGADAHSAAAREKLAQWFWSVTFGELYGSSTESKLAQDVPALVDWVTAAGGPPASLADALFQSSRMRSLRTRKSAAYKGLHALLMSCGCRDFVSGKPVDIMTFFNERIDVHHIFPRKWCESHGIRPAVYNSIVNKTALSKRSNILIGGNAPSKYLKLVEEKHGIPSSKLDEILRTHLIDPDSLRADDFHAFFESRIKALSEIVGQAMGKPVVEAVGANEPEREVEEDFDETSVEQDEDMAAA